VQSRSGLVSSDDERPPISSAESRASADPVADLQPPTGARRRDRVRDALIDLGPLRRSRDFRLLFIGQSVSLTGSMITYVAIPYQVFRLSHSSLLVGLLGLAELMPLLVTALLGGLIADRSDRRRTVLLTEVAMVCLTGCLLVNAGLPHPALWPLFAVSSAFAAVDGIQRPSLDALLPRVVSRAELPAATGLSSLRMNVAVVAGPPLGGLLIAASGLSTAFAVDVLSFGASLLALSLMRATPAPESAPSLGLAAVASGWRYARSRQELMGTYLVDINAMLFGMPSALFPAIATRFGGAGVLGLLYAAPSAGSMLAAITSGWTRRRTRHGRLVAVAAAGWGSAIVAFGLSSALWLAMLMLAVAGAADEVSALFRSRMWNETIPDDMRGRLAGIEMLSYSIGPALGDVEAGGVAVLTSLRVSVVSGGLLCVVGTIVLSLLLPKFMAYDARSVDATPSSALPLST
jgi:MFS family permease